MTAPDPRWSCYCLQSRDNKCTYVGATVDELHRLKQHNGELQGGARATAFQSRRPWRKSITVHQFGNKSRALSFERTWKNVTRRTPWTCTCNASSSRSVCRRLNALTRAIECYESRHGTKHKNQLLVHCAPDLLKAHGGSTVLKEKLSVLDVCELRS
jgi:Predicted endonuclease containing a URI domain